MKKKSHVKLDMLINERVEKTPETPIEKIALFFRALKGAWVFLRSGLVNRHFLMMARPLMMHLEKDIFPELRKRRVRWLLLTFGPSSAEDASFTGQGGGRDYLFPGTSGLVDFIREQGIKKIRLNTSLEYNQILEAFLLFLHTRDLLFSGLGDDCRNESWKKKNLALCMLSREGLHRSCSDIRFFRETGLFEVDYSYCELVLSKLFKQYVREETRLGDHRAFFARAPAVSGGIFIFFAIPYLLTLAGFSMIPFLWVCLGLLFPAAAWFLMYLLGSILYEKEHDELLKSELLRKQESLAKFPETNPNPVIKVGFDGDIKYANPAAVRFARSAVESGQVAEILPEDYIGLTGKGCPKEDVHSEVKVRDKSLRYLISGFSDDCSIIFAGNDITDLRLIEQKLRHMNENLEKLVEERTGQLYETQDTTIICLAGLAEVRDPETGAHIERTRIYVKLLAEKLKGFPKYKTMLTAEYISSLYKSAPLHDIGKVGIPDAILLKAGKLTDEEFEVMKKHTDYGEKILDLAVKKLGFDSFLNIAKEIAQSHHERWDGSGYPRGISGEEIPLSARIMAVADEYDALTSERVYKEAFSHEKAAEIIRSKRGTHFAPDVVDAFMELAEVFMEISQHPESERQVM